MLNEIATSLIGICISNSSSQVYYHGTRKPVLAPELSIPVGSLLRRTLSRISASHTLAYLSLSRCYPRSSWFLRSLRCRRIDNFTSQSVVFHMFLFAVAHTHTHPFEHADTHTHILFLLLLSFLHTHARIV